MNDQEFLTALGQRIKTLREQRKLSQQALADAAGVSDYTIQKMEAGKAKAQVTSVFRVAVALNVPITELFEEMSAKPLDREKRKAVNRIADLFAEQDLETIAVIENLISGTLGLKDRR